jgi:ABC-2 type transport system permease protein
VRFYDIMAEQEEQLSQLFQAYPPEMLVAFGDMTRIFTPAGYLHTEFFSYVPLILGIFIISMGSALLAGDEEVGILDLLMSHPISRARMFFGRLLAFISAIFALLFLVWLAFTLSTLGTKLGVISFVEMALPFISLGVLLLFFGLLALLLSMFLPSQRSAAMLASLLLFASFFLSVLSRLDSSLEQFAKWSPYDAYQGGEAINGLDWEWVGILLGLALLMALVAWWRFERRDLRVSGERGGSLLGWWRRQGAGDVGRG